MVRNAPKATPRSAAGTASAASAAGAGPATDVASAITAAPARKVEMVPASPRTTRATVTPNIEGTIARTRPKRSASVADPGRSNRFTTAIAVRSRPIWPTVMPSSSTPNSGINVVRLLARLKKMAKLISAVAANTRPITRRRHTGVFPAGAEPPRGSGRGSGRRTRPYIEAARVRAAITKKGARIPNHSAMRPPRPGPIDWPKRSAP